jgi:hypothetical protein
MAWLESIVRLWFSLDLNYLEAISMLKDKIKKLVDVYLIEISMQGAKLNLVRSGQISQIISWAELCEEEILVSRLEKELKSWPMSYRFYGSNDPSNSRLWRDLRSTLDAYYRQRDEHSNLMQQDRYERYEEKMTGLVRYMRDIHQDQINQLIVINEEKLKSLREEKVMMERELDLLKSCQHEVKAIRW